MSELIIPREILDKLANHHDDNIQSPRYGNFNYLDYNYSKTEIDLLNANLSKDIKNVEKTLKDIDDGIDKKIKDQIKNIKIEIENEQLKKLATLKNWVIGLTFSIIGLIVTILTAFIPLLFKTINN